jgi:hypothetical protein
MDVKSAFRNGDLKEVYIRQPLGFVIISKENKVLHLRKALYSRRPTGLEREAGCHTCRAHTRAQSTGGAEEALHFLSTTW